MIGILILLSGASLSFVITAMMTHVRVAIPASTRGRALSLVGGSLRVGALIGPFAGGLLADVFGAHTTFLLRACCNAAALAAFLADRRIDQAHSRPSPDTAARGTQKTGGVRLVDQFAAVASGLKGRWRAVITVGFAVLMLMLMRSSRGLVLPLWGDRLSLSATVIGSVISAGAAMDLLLFIPAGVIMDRAGRKVAAGICIGVFMVGLVLLSVSRGVMGFVFASMLIGIGNGFGAGINMTLGTDLAPNGAISEFLGLWRFYGDIGQTTGPAIVGALAAAIGLGPGILAIAGGGLAGLLVLVLIAPETLRLADKVSDGPQPR
jgi:MFS family permease